MKLHVFFWAVASRFSLVAIVLVALCLTVHAQTWTQYDQGTPPQHAAGVSPLGSYISTDLGTINVSNGALNIKLLMGGSGGRGFWLPVTLNYSNKVWSVQHDTTYDPRHQTDVSVAYASYGAEESYIDIYNRIAAGWTISGVPLLKHQVVSFPGCQSYSLYGLDKLTVVLPDKGEIELRDDLSDGAPLYMGCTPNGDYRGRRWHATDGSGAIFISDNDNGVVNGDLVGTLVTSDGTRYRFQNTVQFGGPGVGLARCVSITDRNGNQIFINHFVNASSHVETDYTDQLGRIVTVEESAADPANPSITLALLVTLKGYQNTPQYYKVRTDFLSNHIRSDFNYNQQPILTGYKDRYGYCYGGSPPPTANYLFPTSYCQNQERIDNQPQVTEVDLPDGRSLRFNYNLFGEMAEVLLPTGGKLQYDYAGFISGFPAGNTLGSEYSAQVNQVPYIDRAVIERRTYPDGATLEGSWTYTYGPQLVNGISYACAEVKGYAGSSSNGTLLMDQRHFFLQASRYFNGPTGAAGTGYSLWSTGVEWRTETRDAAGNIINASEQDWAQRTPVSWTSGYTQEQPANDNRGSETRRFLDTGSFAKTDTFYDNANYPQANNVNEVKEYDFDQSLKRRSTTSYVTGSYQTDDSIHLVSLPLQQSVYASDGTTEVARTVNEYDVYANDGNHAPLQDYGSVIGHDNSYGASKVTRGNLTAMGHWLNTNNSMLYSYLRYDTLGNPVGNKDANGNVTTLSYSDDFGDGSNPGAGASGTYGATYALPTLITSPPPTPGAAVHTARSQYDFSTGLLTGFKDRNGIVTQTIYNDSFNRPTSIKAALGITGVEAHSALYYAPATVFGITLANNDVLTAKDQSALDDAMLRSWTHTDGFGRTIESWSRDPQGDDKVATIYDGLGRQKQVSNPYRPSLGETPIYTTRVYDLASRVTSVTTPDSAVVTSSYSGNAVTVTEQTGKSRKSVGDGLGRLTQVYEDPNGLNYLTSYSYDTLDDLTTVSQGGQTRSFVYDSLKRLTSTTNPENGTVSYTYDNNSNMLTRLDARGITTTLAYDALNRPTSKSYNDSNPQTPAVNYFYDAQTLPSGAPSFSRGSSTGRLVAVTYGGGGAGDYFGYDALGRDVLKIQQTGSVNYQTSAVYNRASELTSETYPSVRTVSYAFDQAGRTSSVTGTLGDGTSRNYSTGITYTSLGGLSQEQFGTDTAVYNKLFYNARGQLAEIRESTVGGGTSWNRGAIINQYSGNCWGMCGGPGSTTPMTDNNGNLKRQDTYIPDNASYKTWTDSYTYDNLNRLTRVYEETGNPSLNSQQSYTIDRWGNRTIDYNNTSPSIPRPQFGVDTNTNRLTAPGGYAMGYDNAGNLTNDTYTGQGQRNYDAENRMRQAWANGQWQTYTYDAGGQRVKRNVNGVETWQVYGIGGELLAEYAANGSPSSPQKEYAYRNGALLVTAEPAANIHWLVSDQLGTPRMIFDKTGSLAAMSRHDYLPYGEELFVGQGLRTATMGYGASDGVRQKFTGYEADGETGLNFAEARYQSSTQGRFTSADPLQASAHPTDPQSWNRYAYVRNNPLNFVDPSGQLLSLLTANFTESSFGSVPQADEGNTFAQPDSTFQDQGQNYGSIKVSDGSKGDAAVGGTAGKAGSEQTGSPQNPVSNSGTISGTVVDPNGQLGEIHGTVRDVNTVTYLPGVARPAPAVAALLQCMQDELNLIPNSFPLIVTSTSNGRHNVGSAHYTRDAADLRYNDRGAQKQRRLQAAADCGALFGQDEGKRPKGQKVWGGPHYHVQVIPGKKGSRGQLPPARPRLQP